MGSWRLDLALGSLSFSVFCRAGGELEVILKKKKKEKKKKNLIIEIHKLRRFFIFLFMIYSHESWKLTIAN